MRVIRTVSALLAVLVFLWVNVEGQDTASRLADLPENVQSRISAVLARDLSAFAARTLDSAVELANPEQRLRVRFDVHGAEVQGVGVWRMSAHAFGYGKALQALPSAVPSSRNNRVEYSRDSVTEWYVNGPAGLEQGFTVTSAPAPADGEPLTIAIALAGDLKARLDATNDRLSLINAGQLAELEYTGLSALDAEGKQLHAWLELQGSELLLKVTDIGAKYPITIDPTIKQAKLSASDGRQQDYFGYAVAISGNTLVVGSPYATVGTNPAQGAAYVFVKPATGGWANATETAKLVSSDGQGSDNFGYSVAISGDQIAVGAPNRTTVNGTTGEAYWFLKPTGGWSGTMTERVNLGTSFIHNAQFGYSVAVQNFDVLVGAPGANQAMLIICAFAVPQCGIDATFQGPTVGDRFGTAVALSGTSFVITDPYFSGSQAQFQGAAFVYTHTTQNFFSSATLTQSDGALISQLGISVAMDGNTVAVGAPYAQVGNQPGQGAVYVYAKPTGGWVNAMETGKLTASDGVSRDYMGTSVAVSGKVVVAGAPNHLVGSNSEQGAAYVYINDAGGWRNRTEDMELTSSDGAHFDLFGTAVGVSGATAVVGSPAANTSTGAAYEFNQ